MEILDLSIKVCVGNAGGKSGILRFDDDTDNYIAVFNDGRATRFWMTVTIR